MGGGGGELVVTGADDGLVRVWEGADGGAGGAGGGRGKGVPLQEFDVGCPVTAVCWAADGASVYAAGIDNEIHVRLALFLSPILPSLPLAFEADVAAQIYDLRSTKALPSLTGHTDTPTSLALSPNGSFLLSPSLSSQTLIHDVRPFSPSPSRIHRVLVGAPAGFESTLTRGGWSRDDGGCSLLLF
jgi:Prp8 binding protein